MKWVRAQFFRLDLVPMKGGVDEDDKTYKKMLKKFLIATAFTVPNLIVAMSEEMFSDNPLLELMVKSTGNGFS